MNPLERLSDYLRRVERRMRLVTLTRGAAITAAAALGFTVLAVLMANHFAFSSPSVLWGRILLFVPLALALGLALLAPLLRMNRRRAARQVERRFPEFEERLLTFTERAGENPHDPFLSLLAADTLEVAQAAEPERVAGKGRIASFAALAAGALCVLVWLGTSGPGFLGYGTTLLWGGIPKDRMQPFYDVVVEPGTRTVRKRSDQLVTARLVGFQTRNVRVFARYASSSKWEEAAMRPRPGGAKFEFLFAAIPESTEYYVEAGGLRSKHYRFNVADLPAVKRIRVTYHFPSWTGMSDGIEDPGGDLRAVQGTVAELAVQTDKPLANGAMLLDDGSRLELRSSNGNWHVARVPILKDGTYHIASVEQGEAVRLSEDYFIEAQRDHAPTVRISRPGRDAKVNPIEEVAVTVDGGDDFGLQGLDLHYSVNGAAEKTVSLLNSKGAKSAQGTYTLCLEDFKMSPGDLVSLYATSRDARTTSQTDIFFVEAQPFEREYSQSQQSGGSGSGEEDGGNRISQRQKEIIAATWNQLKDKSGDPKAATDNAKFLSDVQSKLRDQARSLASRMRSRQLSGSNESFQSFAKDMEQAVEAMGPASEKLKGKEWQSALAPEQKALQHLLRAEATFRQIQVAFGSRSGGGGGGGGAGRDLEGLFDLELDTEKNQYESGQQAASADQRQREIDEALQKLEQLARRQQELAEQQRQNQQTSQQRWQQEMLRREAEQLQQKIEQLSRNSSSQQQMQQMSRQGQPSQGGGQGSQSQQLQQAIQRLEQATRDMRQAQAQPQSEAEARRAAERLQEARKLLSGMRREQTGQQVGEIARKAEELAQHQSDFNKRLREAFGSPGAGGQKAAPAGQQHPQELAQEKQRELEEFQRLEREVQQAARDLQGSQREASNKLRQALGEVQQEELPLRMNWTAEALRRGLGEYAVMREAMVTEALNNLRDRLQEAQKAMAGDQQQKDGNKGLEQALATAERMRQQMEQMARGLSQGRSGRQPGQQAQQGQPGQQQGQQGRQQGQQGRQQSGSTERGYSAMNRGDWQPAPGGTDVRATSPEDFERAYREGMRDLGRLQQALEGNAQVGEDIQALLREMQRLDPKRFPGNPELVERLNTQVLGGMEQLELQLRRMLEEKQGGNVRSGAGEPVPPGYAESVAEYFRRLSKTKQ